MSIWTRFMPLALVVLWSSGYVGATLAAQVAPAATTLLWRFATAGVVLVAIVVVLGRRYSARFLRRETAVGLLGQCGYLLGIFLAAQLGAPAGTTALIASLQPALVAVVLALTGDGGDLRQAGGLVLGILGVAIVVGGANTSGWAGVISAALGMVSLAAATVLSHHWPQPPGHDLLDSLAVQSVVATAFFLLLASLRGGAVPPATLDFWIAIGWIAVLSFVGGYGAYLLVLRDHGPLAVSAWLYLTPGTTAVWAAAMFGEALTVQTLVGLTVAAAGVATVLPPHRLLWAAARRHPRAAAALRRPTPSYLTYLISPGRSHPRENGEGTDEVSPAARR